MPEASLRFEGVDTYYGGPHILKDFSYAIGHSEIVRLLGGNASGKSTTVKTIMGVVRPVRGRVVFDGQLIERLPTSERVRRGIAPVLEARRGQVAGTLSGGEQQMVAIGRALMARPRLVCMDEPSMRLPPLYVERVFDIIQAINQQGTTIFMVEQNAAVALVIAHRAYVLQAGQVALSGPAADLARDPRIQEAHLGELQVAV